jgi:hypothetical protein
MKVYDFQWFTAFGMSYAEAAAELRADGIETVLVQNRLDPLPTSGVDQDLSRVVDRMANYDDRAWAAALREAGLRCYQTTATFFDPAALATFPDARAVNARGEPDRGFDWYLGICPTHEGYLAAKIARLTQVVETLLPDGLFLSFTRYPGFWESWTPDYRFSDADRFCFCDRCRALFARELDIALPTGDTAAQARFILDEHGAAWMRWRCRQVGRVVARIASAVRDRRPRLRLMLNTLPFPVTDFDGFDARREIAAQDLGSLAEWIDAFELMTYLQILRRPAAWLEPAIDDARQALTPDRAVYCTLQVAPLYLDGVHAGKGRAPDVTARDLEIAARTALHHGADGLVFYHWTDFLLDERAGGDKRRALRAVARG